MKNTTTCIIAILSIPAMVVAAQTIGECLGVENPGAFAFNLTGFVLCASYYIYFLFKG